MIIFLNFSQNSSNISSDPPIFQCFFIFSHFFFPLAFRPGRGHYRSHHMGYYRTTRYFFQELLNSSVALVRPDPDELRWVRPKKLDAPMTAAPLGIHPSLLLPVETSVLTYTSSLKCSGLSVSPSCRVGTVGGQLWIYTPDILYVHLCVSQSERDRLRDGGLCCKKKGNFLP